MKTIQQQPQQQTCFLQKAESSAATSQKYAKEALDAYSEIRPLEEQARAWDQIFSSSSPYLVTVACLACAVVEGLLSMDLYREMIPYPFVWILADIGMLILAFKTGNYLRTISREEFDFALYEERRRNPDMSEADHLSRVSIDAKSDRRIGWTMLVVTSILVLGLSWHRRVNLLHESFTIIDLMPCIFYVLTIFSSIHIAYVAKRLHRARLVQRKKKYYAECNGLCQLHTANAVYYFQKALNSGENLQLLSTDLKQTVHRYRNNTSQSDTYAYVETLPEQPFLGIPENIPSQS